MFDNPCDALECKSQRSRLLNPTASNVIDKVSAVGSQRLSILKAKPGRDPDIAFAEGVAYPQSRGLVSERHDLDRQGKPPQHRHSLGRVGNDDAAARGFPNEFLT